MKLKSLIWTLGLQPAPRTYDHEIRRFELPKDGTVEYAKWLHPKDYSHEFSQQFLDQLRRFISPGDFAIDIGAHTGDFTLPIALAAGSEGLVLAVEPNEYVYKCLEATASLNLDKTNIAPLQAAATETEGPVEFCYSDPGYCNGGNLDSISRWKHGHPFRLTVPGVRIHDWILENLPEQVSRLSFVKIDAEGYDLNVLESMSELITQQNPCIHIEMYRHLPADRRIKSLERLTEFGYRPHVVTDDADWCGGPVLEAKNVMHRPHYDLFCVPA